MCRDPDPQHADKPCGASAAPAELPGTAALWHPAQLLGGATIPTNHFLAPAAPGSGCSLKCLTLMIATLHQIIMLKRICAHAGGCAEAF